MIRLFNYDSVPSSNNDNFGEDKPPGDINAHTPADIRRAGWKGIVSGGVGFHVRHNATNDCALGIISNCDKPFTVTGIQSQLDSEQWLKLVNPFVQTRLGATFGSMVPDSGLVTNGFALADPARTKILYLYMGVNDTWDNGTSSPMTVKLTGITKDFDASWYDTRTGVETSAGTLTGNQDHVLAAPSTDDWVLLLESMGSSSAPSPPANLRTTAN